MGLIKDKKLQVVSLKKASPYHVVDATWGADDDVWALFKVTDVFLDNSLADANVDPDAQLLTNRRYGGSDLN